MLSERIDSLRVERGGGCGTQALENEMALHTLDMATIFLSIALSKILRGFSLNENELLLFRKVGGFLKQGIGELLYAKTRGKKGAWLYSEDEGRLLYQILEITGYLPENSTEQIWINRLTKLSKDLDNVLVSKDTKQASKLEKIFDAVSGVARAAGHSSEGCF
jgi:hypothetical protein